MSVSSSSQIYVLDGCDFKIEGQKYDVSTISMEVSTNAIPTCTVGVAPNGAGAAFDGMATVSTFNVESLQEEYKSLTERAERLVECDLSLKLRLASGRALPVDPKLELKKWLLISVGLTRLSTTQGFSILCTLAHPAYKLMLRTGFFFTSKGTVNFDDKSKEAKDPVDAAKKAIEAVQDANSEEGGIKIPFSEGVETSAGFKSDAEVAKDIEESIKTLKEDLEKPLLIWDKETYADAKYDIPCENLVSKIEGGKEAMQYVLTTSWAGAMNQSAWDALVSDVCPEFGLEVIPKYDDDKLVVSPWMPWTKPKIELQDYMIESMLLPGKDQEPLYGYLLYEGASQAPSNPCITMPNGSLENDYIGRANMAFVPSTSKSSVGTLRHAGRPSWLDTAIQKAATFGKLPTITQKEEDYDEGSQSEQPPGSSGDNKDMSAWNAVIFSYLNNLFLAEYKRTVAAELSCAFLPNWEGQLIHPGIRMAVKTGDKTLFTGRITRISHVIDCTTSRASTAISLSYCLNGDTDQILGTEPESPFYGATGKLT